MQFEEVMAVLKNVKTVPQSQLAQKLLRAVQFTDSDIRNVLFNSVPVSQAITYNAQQAQPLLREFAVKYVAFTVSRCTARSFDATVRNVSYAAIQQWFSDNGVCLGLWMLIDYLLYTQGLVSIQSNADEILSALLQHGQDPAFVNGFLIECDTAGTHVPAKLFLNLFNVLDASGSKLQAVLPTWKADARWTAVQDFDSVNWLESVAPSFAQDTDPFNVVKNAIDQAISTRTGPYSYTTREVVRYVGRALSPIYGTVTHERYEYGEALLNWLNQPGGPAQYQMRSAVAPDNFEVNEPESSGCIRENTPIRMADGSLKLIQDIAPGDLVLNGHGSFSVCSSEKIFNPYVREMYGINAEPVFMSPEHALMTDRGWCSLHPALCRQINPNVRVSRLEPGDRLWRFKSLEAGELIIEKVLVTRINVERTPGEGFVGYDLHYSEGYHSYFANDYLCLLNYPEITIANILANVKRYMSAVEEMQFIRMVKENEVLFKKLLGTEAVRHLVFSLSR